MRIICIGFSPKRFRLGLFLRLLALTAAAVVAIMASYGSGLFIGVLGQAGPDDTVVVIDAGHGGEDGGAVARDGTVESHINLNIALKLEQMMRLYGVSCVMIRREDISIYDEGAATLREKKISDLKNRVDIVNAINDAILISIHQNTFASAKYCGAQTFYTDNEQSRLFAEKIQENLKSALDPENSRVAAAAPSGVYLLSHVNCPAVLVECGFLSNAQEAQKLIRDAYQIKIAAALTAAYFTRDTGGEQT